MKLAIASAIAAALLFSAPAVQARAPAAAATEQVHLDKRRIDAALAQMLSSGRAVGVSALVWQDGREAYYGQQGLADREAKRPWSRDTLAQIFSMTKPVTGVALMQLWEQGKFRLDDPLAQYLPEFANMRVQDGVDAEGKPKWRAATRPITIRDVMRHTAGFSYGFGQTAADEEFRKINPLALTNNLTEFGQKLATVPLLAEPGTQWHYSSAVDVQGLLVEKLSGQALTDYVAQHIFTPLKMRESGWHQPMERLPRLAIAYQKGADGQLTRVPDAQLHAMNFPGSRMTMGGAGIVAPIDDYMRFARMLLNGGELDGARILKPATVRLMATDHLDPAITERDWLPGKVDGGFGFDFAVRTRQPSSPNMNRGAVGEFFWDGMASTLFWIDPANKLAVVFFVQALPFDGTLHTDIRKAVYGAAYLGPPGD
ncbi:beta-lactamase family protein [Sandaracinobacter neustonicus]|uniref:Beta-lactamase family protein n=2 Tax=Sandaracinobacter neustonicus TaxID=1715348 RepID=A0A501XUY1_9SPHN|nr:beta-lactamase family protein [Sandaracinobacter neustonicus]